VPFRLADARFFRGFACPAGERTDIRPRSPPPVMMIIVVAREFRLTLPIHPAIILNEFSPMIGDRRNGRANTE
jgi:hypothetical protein